MDNDSGRWQVSDDFDLMRMTVRGLLRLESAINAELRARGLVQTNNKPIGEIGEHIVLAARGGVLEPNSTKSHDITTPSGARIQAKAMGGRRGGPGAVFSAFRSFDFDTAVFLVFDALEFVLVEAYEASAQIVEDRARFAKHVNGRLATLRQVRAFGTDVLPEMTSAYALLDVQRTRE